MWHRVSEASVAESGQWHGNRWHPGARTQQEIALYVERYMEQMMMWRTDER